MKLCNICKESLPYENFHKRRSSKDGYRYECKKCRKTSDKKYYDSNKSLIVDKVRKRRETDKSYLESNKKYREENKEFINQLRKEWAKSENGKISKKKYYEKNSAIIKQKSSLNREKRKDQYLEKEKERRQSPEYKKNHNEYNKRHRVKNPHIYAWRSLLRNTLKRLNTKKSQKTIEVLGYSAEDLKKHIESLFKEGMTWENYGEWHIDHIKPVSLFHKDEDVKVINSLENLQPLWASENLLKYNNYN